MKKDINTTHSLIKSFLKNNLNKQFIYYKNPSSIKIQLHTSLTKQLIEFLEFQNINFVLEHPKFIVRNFRYIQNMDEVKIKFSHLNKI